MEIDLTKEEREFIVDAIESHLSPFPEFGKFADHFIDLLKHCGKVGVTLHIN